MTHFRPAVASFKHQLFQIEFLACRLSNTRLMRTEAKLAELAQFQQRVREILGVTIYEPTLSALNEAIKKEVRPYITSSETENSQPE
jgi:hypothetical protein